MITITTKGAEKSMGGREIEREIALSTTKFVCNGAFFPEPSMHFVGNMHFSIGLKWLTAKAITFFVLIPFELLNIQCEFTGICKKVLVL